MSASDRVERHPILEVPEHPETVEFTFDGHPLEARRSEMVSSALFANGARVFGRHRRDGSPHGIFCANGQCAQCLVLSDGVPVKACVTPVRPRMDVRPLSGLPELLADDAPMRLGSGIPEVDTDVLVVGGGPAGLTAAVELGTHGVPCVLCDDQQILGGKLGLQTHNFFGSVTDSFAGERGTDIGWKKGGNCFPAFDAQVETTVKGLLPTQQRHRLAIDWLDAEGIRKVVPGIRTDGLRGGTYSPDNGQVSPLLAAESFTNEAVRLGAVFRYRESVTSLVREGNAVVGVRTEKGEYRAPAVVNASGVHATEIGRMARLDIPVTPESHEGGISAPVRPFLDPLVVDLRPGPEGKTLNFYFGQDSNGQIIFCYTPKVPFPGENRTSTYEFMPIVAARLVELLPRLKNLTIRRVWRGLYPMTPDGNPVVGRAPGVDGFYLGVGMCGQGFMLGPGVGKTLASLVARGAPTIDQEVFDRLSPSRDLSASRKEALK